MIRQKFESLQIQVKKDKIADSFSVRTKNRDADLQKALSMILMHKHKSPGGVW